MAPRTVLPIGAWNGDRAGIRGKQWGKMGAATAEAAQAAEGEPETEVWSRITAAWLMSTRDRAAPTSVTVGGDVLGQLIHARQLHDLAQAGSGLVRKAMDYPAVSWSALAELRDWMRTQAIKDERGIIIRSIDGQALAGFFPRSLGANPTEVTARPSTVPPVPRPLCEHPLVVEAPIAWSRLGARTFPLIGRRSQCTVVTLGGDPVAVIVPIELLIALGDAEIELARATLEARIRSWSSWTRPGDWLSMKRPTQGRFRLTYNADLVGGVFSVPTFRELLDEIADVRGGRFLQTYPASLEDHPLTPEEEAEAAARLLALGFAAVDDANQDSDQHPAMRKHREQLWEGQRRKRLPVLLDLLMRSPALARHFELREADPAAYTRLVRRINGLN